MKGKCLKACFTKWRKMGSSVIPCSSCEWCYQEGSSIPRDVPKGHLVVYVGDKYRRFVIKITVLKHPLFKALLDQAQDEYDFNNHSKLCIPCDEGLFLHVVQCAGSQLPDPRPSLCL